MRTQQIRQTAHLAPAHGIGLAGQREGASAGPADLAGGQVQVDQRGVLGRAAAGLVEALAIQAERGLARRAAAIQAGKQACGLEQSIFADATGLRHHIGGAVAHSRLQFLKAAGVRGKPGRIYPALPQHQMQHAVEQHHVGAGLDGQMQVGHVGGVGAPGIDHHNLQCRIVFLGVFDAAKQHRVRVGRVGPDDEKRFAKIHIVIAGRGRVGTQGLFVAGHRAAHAQARVGVYVVAAHQALGQFVEDVIVFGEQLARHIKAHRIRAVLADDAGELCGRLAERRIPAHRLRRSTSH